MKNLFIIVFALLSVSLSAKESGDSYLYTQGLIVQFDVVAPDGGRVDTEIIETTLKQEPFVTDSKIYISANEFSSYNNYTLLYLKVRFKVYDSKARVIATGIGSVRNIYLYSCQIYTSYMRYVFSDNIELQYIPNNNL
ncbi:MAG: hypothetical protein N4A72_16565 [Bacteroidales bacterium]|jgi:hypothetical protein|nr:hypothetical protein [Bacteroidales bacterium]